MAKKLPAFALLFRVLPALLHASTPRDPYQYFVEQTLGNLTKELEIARAEGKQVTIGNNNHPAITLRIRFAADGKLAAGLPVNISIDDN